MELLRLLTRLVQGIHRISKMIKVDRVFGEYTHAIYVENGWFMDKARLICPGNHLDH